MPMPMTETSVIFEEFRGEVVLDNSSINSNVNNRDSCLNIRTGEIFSEMNLELFPILSFLSGEALSTGGMINEVNAESSNN